MAVTLYTRSIITHMSLVVENVNVVTTVIHAIYDLLHLKNQSILRLAMSDTTLTCSTYILNNP